MNEKEELYIENYEVTQLGDMKRVIGMIRVEG